MIYYVDGTSGDDDNPGTITEPWETIGKANTILIAGDTVYIRAGTYNISGSAIDPSNTGSEGSLITYSGYEEEEINFVGASVSSFAIDLDSEYGTIRSYIKVTKLNFLNFNQHLWIRRGSHNEISYCSVIGMYDDENLPQWIGSTMYRNATYNWVHHCTFGEYGYFGGGDDEGVLFEIGNDDVATGDDTHHNLVENCIFYHGGHHVVSVDGYKNVFRNNYIRNDPWSPVETPTYGNRIMFTVGATDNDVYRNLIEGNRIAFGGETVEEDQIGGAGGSFASSYNIIRRNVFDHCLIYGIYLTHYTGQTSSKYNHVYHNVFWYNGYSITGPEKSNWDNAYTHGIMVNENATYVHGNIFKNNIFYQNKCLKGAQYSIIEPYPEYDLPDLQTISDNWFDDDGDSEFTNITGTPDPNNKDQFDFNLKSTSPCINKGGFLTTITSESGSGTSFTVEDVGYFMDGWGIIDGDEIQLQGQTITAIITNVDYETNEITVDTSLTWTTGQGVALKYSGSAPDMGALESSFSSNYAKLVMLLR